MANVINVDELITKYRLVDDYTHKAQKIISSNQKLGMQIKSVSKLIVGLGATLATLALGGLVNATAGIVETGIRLEALQLGLKSISKTTEEYNQQLGRLKQVAKLPGLTFEEAIRGSINLQGAGFGAVEAADAIANLGNALAQAGRGSDEFFAMIRALAQIMNKSKVQAEEVNQLAEHLPQIREVIKRAIGTADTEIIQKAKIDPRLFVSAILRELGKLPRVAAKGQVAVENLRDAFIRFQSSIYTGFASSFSRDIGLMTQAIDNLASSGKLAAWGQGLVNIFKSLYILIKFVVASLGALVAGAIFMGLIKLVMIISAAARGMTLFAIATAAANAFMKLSLISIFAFAAAVAILVGTFEYIYGQFNAMEEAFDRLVFSRPAEQDMPTQNDTQKLMEQLYGGGVTDPLLAYLQNIDQSTKLTARNTQPIFDMKKYALGGGDLGKDGITPAEVFAGRGRSQNTRSNQGSVHLNITGGDRRLRSFVEDIVVQTLQQTRGYA